MNGMADPHDTASDRTLMAEERTFSAWVRTGLTSVATGLGIAKLIPTNHVGPLAQGLGILLILAGAMTFMFAFWGYQRGAQNWTGALPRAVPLWMMALLSLLLISASGLALVLVVTP